MKEIQNILTKSAELKPGEKAILATVVDVVGSGYRRPGARMLIDERGYSIGTVSGGCLEADVLERAKKVLASGEPAVITYDTTKDENSLFGLSMGCRGIVRILLEPFEKENALHRNFQTVFEKRARRFIGTIISANENRFVGGRIFLDGDRSFEKQNLPDELENHEQFKNDCKEFFARDRSSEVRLYEIGDARCEVFFENIAPPLKLLIFGAGYDALPLIKFAKELGWHTTAIDHRPAFADKERLADADEIILSTSEDLSAEFFHDENAAAVVMTHNYERDREILRRLLNSNFRYIGALGPKKRTEKLLAEIGGSFRPEQLENLYAPVGLDIGGASPETIALAIAAEIQSVLGGRGGGFLRDRQGSIYDRKQ
jgi:xanthine dehydrogenase accessory factor